MDQWEIAVRVPADLAETVASVLLPLGDGLAIDVPYEQATPEDDPVPLPDALATVRLYVTASDGARERDALRSRVNRVLRPFTARASVRRVREQDWVEACRQSFVPQRVGRRLVIVPPWSIPPAGPDDVRVVIEPGLAFGTGDHPTTRACLEAVEQLVRSGTRVLDLGCGSGILGITAALLGAGTVLALDIDPMAIDAARGNAERNGVGGLLTIEQGTLSADRPYLDEFDLVLANIASGPLIALAPDIARALAPGSAVVASGVIAERLAGVVEAFESVGLRIENTIAEGEWRTVVARRG